jgi:hypothetical protein
MSFDKVISPEISEMGIYLTLMRSRRKLIEMDCRNKRLKIIGIISYKNIAIINQ